MPAHFRNRRMHIYEGNKTNKNWIKEKCLADRHNHSGLGKRDQMVVISSPCVPTVAQ